MKLSDVVRAVRPSIVAFMPMYRVSLSPSSPPDEHPPIIGTEFIVHERGLVVTNHHVYEALRQLPRPPDAPAGEWPAVAVLFHEITKAKYPKAATDGYAAIPLGIAGVLKELQLSKEAIYYGPRRPDIALVHVKVTGLPALELLADHSAIEVGAEVGTLGYPMGREALIAPGWVHQIGPFLQTGIVSAVLPFPGRVSDLVEKC
jgi:S1-C subfamily serine protease